MIATLAGGVVGRTLHPHLDDQIGVWAGHDSQLYWWFSDAKIEENTVTELRLRPSP